MRMKLIIAIVHDEDANKLSLALAKEGFQSTKLASTGGFLRRGNTTILIGIEKEKIDKIFDIIEKTCRTREYSPASSLPSDISAFVPSGVEVGGATVFVLDVDRYITV